LKDSKIWWNTFWWLSVQLKFDNRRFPFKKISQPYQFQVQFSGISITRLLFCLSINNYSISVLHIHQHIKTKKYILFLLLPWCVRPEQTVRPLSHFTVLFASKHLTMKYVIQWCFLVGIRIFAWYALNGWRNVSYVEPLCSWRSPCRIIRIIRDKQIQVWIMEVSVPLAWWIQVDIRHRLSAQPQPSKKRFRFHFLRI